MSCSIRRAWYPLPRADGDVAAPVDGLVQCVELLDGGGEIRVREEDAIAPCVCKTDLERMPLAPIPLVTKRPNWNFQLASEIANQLERPVLAPVVHQNELGRVPPRRKMIGDGPQGLLQPARLVVGGNDDAEIGTL